MSDSLLELRHRIGSAHDLAGVVHTMKALAASRINQFEAAVTALQNYSNNVEQGLALALKSFHFSRRPAGTRQEFLIAYGSDQGLVGQFNDLLADHVVKEILPAHPRLKIMVVGERLADQLKAHDLQTHHCYPVPTGVEEISRLGNQILLEEAALITAPDQLNIILCHNQISDGRGFQPHSQTVLPLDQAWEQHLSSYTWPTNQLPELCGQTDQILRALLGEYLFITLFQACAEALASENLCRLTAMQRAEKNISERLEDLQRTYHHLRQETIDAELFDVLAGFDLCDSSNHHRL